MLLPHLHACMSVVFLPGLLQPPRPHFPPKSAKPEIWGRQMAMAWALEKAEEKELPLPRSMLMLCATGSSSRCMQICDSM